MDYQKATKLEKLLEPLPERLERVEVKREKLQPGPIEERLLEKSCIVDYPKAIKIVRE